MIIANGLLVAIPTFSAYFLTSLDPLILFLLLSHVWITLPCSSTMNLING